jgi:hypothetical protein
MLFTIVLAGHIVAALICVIAGVVAMLSPKRRGRHPRCGTIYYGSLALVFVSATILSALRWPQARNKAGGDVQQPRAVRRHAVGLVPVAEVPCLGRARGDGGAGDGREGAAHRRERPLCGLRLARSSP